MQIDNECIAGFPASQTLEQGQITRPKATTSAKARLGHPNATTACQANEGPSSLQPRDR
jgi:hypothetical protein